MNKIITRFPSKWAKRTFRFVFFAFLSLTCLLATKDATATHFRYGTMTWERVTAGPPNTVKFTMNTAWRRSFGWGVTPNIGTVITGIPYVLNFGDGGTAPITLTVTSVNIAEDWFYATFTVTKTYSTAGPYTAFFQNCCKLSATSGPTIGLSNGADNSWRIETVVNTTGGNDAPICNMPPIISLPTNNANASFTMLATDPNNDVLRYSLSTPAQMCEAGQPCNNPQAPGLSVDSITGVVTLNTVGKAINTLWTGQIRIRDSKGAVIIQDMIFKIVGSSTPPVFDYSITPPINQYYKIQPGQNLSFQIKAIESDFGDTATVFAVGVPGGATFSPALPRKAKQPQTTFSWTPTGGQLGYYVITFTAQDLNTLQSFTTVRIQVSLDPIFIAPTRADSSGAYLEVGDAFSEEIRAKSPVPNMDVRINAITGFPGVGATLSQSIPTSFSDTAAVSLNWTPVNAQWGEQWINYSAQDTINGVTVRHLGYFVNETPSFTSSPILTATIGQLYTYNIVVADGDLPYGDDLEILAGLIPSWLTLTDNGNGTATLTGTPSVSDIGLHDVHLEAEDIAHHSHAHVEQEFEINVIGIPPTVGCPFTGYQQIYAGANCTQTFTYNPTISGIPAPVVSHKFSGATTDSSSGTGSGSAFNVGQTTVTIYASNAVGTSSCSFVVTVVDTIKPVVVTKNITVYLNSAGQVTINPSDVDDGSSDNCGSVTLSLQNSGTICGQATENQNVFLTAPTGTLISAINFASYGTPNGSCGNFTIGTCHSNTSISQVSSYALGNNSAVIPATNGVFGDPCYGTVKRLFVEAQYTTSSTQNGNFTCSNIGSNTIFLYVSDVNGNVKIGSATVTVLDTITPSLIGTLPSGQTGMDLCKSAAPTGPTIADIAALYSDNCSVIVSKTGSVSGTDCSWSVTYTYDVHDGNGNHVSPMPTVTYSGGDTTAPTALAQNVTVTLSNGTATVTAAQVNNGSSDACSGTNVSLSLSDTSFTCADIGSNQVTLTVTDACNNSSTTTATVTVVGSIPTVSIAEGILPDFCQGGVKTLTANGTNGVTYLWSPGSATSKTINVSSSGTYTVTVTNGNGCTATASYTVTVSPGDLLSSYVILSTDEVKLHKNSIVQTGGVGSSASPDNCKKKKGKIKVENNSTITGSSTFARAMEIEVKSGSTVTTQYDTAVTTPYPSFKYHPYKNSGNNVNVSNGSTVTLNDTIYKEVNIGSNATVTFTASKIYLKKLQSNTGSTIKFSNCAVVIIDDKLDIGKNNQFNPDGYSAVVYVEKKVDVDEGSTVKGAIYGLEEFHTKGKVNARVSMTGQFIANDFHSDYTTWNWSTNCGGCTFNKMQNETADNNIDAFLKQGEVELKVFPNPSNGAFNIELNTTIQGELNITVYNYLGQQVRNISRPEFDGLETINIDLSNEASTYYIVKVEMPGQTMYRKVIIAK